MTETAENPESSRHRVKSQYYQTDISRKFIEQQNCTSNKTT